MVKKQIILNRSQPKKTKIDENIDSQQTAKRLKLSHNENKLPINKQVSYEPYTNTQYEFNDMSNFNFSDFNFQNYNKPQTQSNNYTYENNQYYNNTQYPTYPIYNYIYDQNNYQNTSIFSYGFQSIETNNYYSQYNYSQ